jgi:hypothetical protein
MIALGAWVSNPNRCIITVIIIRGIGLLQPTVGAPARKSGMEQCVNGCFSTTRHV